MTKFHINPETRMPARCRSEKGQCPFGGDDKHYPDRDTAFEASEQELNQEYGLLPTTQDFEKDLTRFYTESEYGLRSLQSSYDRAHALGGRVVVIFAEGRDTSHRGHSIPLRAFHVANDGKIYEGNVEWDTNGDFWHNKVEEIRGKYGKFAHIVMEEPTTHNPLDDENTLYSKFYNMQGIFSRF